MAMIDYGAVVIKNGSFINKKQFFQVMIDAVGWEDNPGPRYNDCRHRDQYNHSMCFPDCPYLQQKIMIDKYGEYVEIRDCHGARFESQAADLRDNYLAYIGDKDITLCFYKSVVAVAINGEHTETLHCGLEHRRSYRAEVNGAVIHIHPASKHNDRVWHCEMSYKGDNYHVVFGYGIDTDMNVWNRVKVRYLGKRAAKDIDMIFGRYICEPKPVYSPRKRET